jgi:hypothetical protein
MHKENRKESWKEWDDVMKTQQKPRPSWLQNLARMGKGWSGVQNGKLALP